MNKQEIHAMSWQSEVFIGQLMKQMQVCDCTILFKIFSVNYYLVLHSAFKLFTIDLIYYQ